MTSIYDSNLFAFQQHWTKMMDDMKHSQFTRFYPEEKIIFWEICKVFSFIYEIFCVNLYTHVRAQKKSKAR